MPQSGMSDDNETYTYTLAILPSAASADMLVDRFQGFTSEVLMHPVHELVSRQCPLRLDDRPLAM